MLGLLDVHWSLKFARLIHGFLLTIKSRCVALKLFTVMQYWDKCIINFKEINETSFKHSSHNHWSTCIVMSSITLDGYYSAATRIFGGVTPLSSPLPQIPSPPLPASPPTLPIPLPAASPPLQLLSSDRRADRPEVTLLPQKRLIIVHCPRYEAGESSDAVVARQIEGRRADYGFVDSIEVDIR
nr:hypothetical protein [Tanacetum cinerariifolium]